MRSRGTLLVCAGVVVVALLAPSLASAAERPATHTHPRLPAPGQAAAPPPLGATTANGTVGQSMNWSGYDVLIGPYESVTATWVQPAVRRSGAIFSDAAFWVGLDGDGSGTVEQIGTEGYSEGVVGYDAWYEMYPKVPVVLGMSIKPGDTLTATVSWTTPAAFTLILADTTSGQTVTRTATMSIPPALASAEIIVEAPTGSSGIVPLANFGVVTFTDCAIDGQSISAYDWQRIDMVSEEDGTTPVADTSDLGADGASFSVSSDVTAPVTTAVGADSRWHRSAVTLTFKAMDGAGGVGVASTEYSTDGGTTWTSGTTYTVAAPADHSADGPNVVLYRATDRAGNVEKTKKATVRIDTRRPVLETGSVSSADYTFRHGRTASIWFSVDDQRPGSPTATVTGRIRDRHGVLVKKVVWRAVKADAMRRHSFLCTLPAGRYRLSLTAVDAAGNRQAGGATVRTLTVR